jgi:uncharacterized protein (TIGR02246 family)
MPSDVHKAIAVVNRMFTDAYARGDAAGVAALYTTDGQILPPNSEMITGHEPIAGFWQFVMGLGIATVRLDSSELAVQGGMAVEIGRYTLGGADGNTVDTGKYLVVWRNEGGNWRLHWDIWNTSMPA